MQNIMGWIKKLSPMVTAYLINSSVTLRITAIFTITEIIKIGYDKIKKKSKVLGLKQKLLRAGFLDNNFFRSFINSSKVSFGHQDKAWQQKNYLNYDVFFQLGSLELIKKELISTLHDEPQELIKKLRNIARDIDLYQDFNSDLMQYLPPNFRREYYDLILQKTNIANLVPLYLQRLQSMNDWGGPIEVAALHELYQINIKINNGYEKEYLMAYINSKFKLNSLLVMNKNLFTRKITKAIRSLALVSPSPKHYTPISGPHKQFFYRGHQIQVRNLLQYDQLWDEGLMCINSIPRDGNCLFSACFSALKDVISRHANSPKLNKHCQNILLGEINASNFRKFITGGLSDKIEQIKALIKFYLSARQFGGDIMPPGIYLDALNRRINKKERIDFEREAILYIIYMCQPGTWGGEIEMQIISDLFKVNIYLNRLHPNKSFILPSPVPTRYCLQLLKYDHAHYDWLSPVKNTVAMLNYHPRKLARSCSTPAYLSLDKQSTSKKIKPRN